MSFTSPYRTFLFEGYQYDKTSHIATYRYSFDGQRHFVETAQFSMVDKAYDEKVLERTLILSYILAGVSYYKCFPTQQVDTKGLDLSRFQADFFSEFYRDGLSQFVYENGLSPSDIARFSGEGNSEPVSYAGSGISTLQSGGKDSLLLAELLGHNRTDTTLFYIGSSGTYPRVLDTIGYPLRTVRRHLDTTALRLASDDGGLNGHVPITYIVFGYALIDGVLHGDNTVLAAIGREGEEPYVSIGEYAIRHQWAKTWRAEQMFANYISSEVSADIRVGSPLRGWSELKIAEVFSKLAWTKYRNDFSSCNAANYRQGHDNTNLQWCGNCAKCANSFLLFAPFIDPNDLQTVLSGNLFEKELLQPIFKGLLGIDGVTKPFECVGETDELRRAYHLALGRGYQPLPFTVPDSDYDYNAVSDAAPWALDVAGLR